MATFRQAGLTLHTTSSTIASMNLDSYLITKIQMKKKKKKKQAQGKKIMSH
jgi:hypothetical protein